MFRRLLSGCGIYAATAILLGAAEAAVPATSAPHLSAAAIVEKNVAARGGLQAWRGVQAMSLEGKMGVGGNQRAVLPMPSSIPPNKKAPVAVRPAEEVYLPFIMDLKRPRKMRFELQFKGQTAVQVYDGTNGWKLRPFLNRRVIEPYTSDEIRIASMQEELDGPLVDYAAKGTRVELAGMEKIEDRDNYKLTLTRKNGQTSHIWIDANTFLETKMEGQPRTLDGVAHPVEVYLRDYRPVSGLQVPFLLETKVLPVAQTALGVGDPRVPVEKMVIEKVAVNPKLEETLFAKPEVQIASITH